MSMINCSVAGRRCAYWGKRLYSRKQVSISLMIFTLLIVSSRDAGADSTPAIKPVPILSQSDVMQWVGGLGLVIILILISAWVLRQFNQVSISQGKRLKILGGLSVGARERVVLLQVGEKQLLLGVAPGRVEKLHVLDSVDIEKSQDDHHIETETGNFADRLRHVMQGK